MEVAWETILAVAIVIGVIAALIGNIEKILSPIKNISNKIILAWRARIVKTYHPLIQEECTAKKDVGEIGLLLIEMNRELRLNSRITMRTLGAQINDKCDKLMHLGFVEQQARDQLIGEYADYFLSNGNGSILANVSAVLQLPYIKGGQPVDVDVGALVERYINTHR